MNYACLDGYDFEQENVLDLNETLIFGGVILKHFGHLMTECLSRLWFILENEKYQNTKIGVLTLPNQEDFIFDFFRLCGIERDRVVIITSILHVKKIVVPEQSVELWRGYRSKYTSIYEYMAKKAGRKSYKKIFLTRTAFSKKDSVNEEFFDTFYKKREYEIVSPEKFSIEEQIAYIAGADEIVCTEGTLSHLSLFAKEGAKVIIFRRDDDVCLIPQMIVNQAKNLDITYIDTTFNFLPTKHNNGCYFYGATSEFIDYLIAAGIEYREEEVKFEIDKYCYEYIKLWCKNFNAKKNFNDISEYDLVDILNRMNRVFGCSKLSRKEFITKDKKREANLKEQIKEYQKEIELLKECEAVR